MNKLFYKSKKLFLVILFLFSFVISYDANGQIQEESLVNRCVLLAKTHGNVYYFSPNYKVQEIDEKKLLTLCVKDLVSKSTDVGSATYYIRKYYEPLCYWYYYSIDDNANPLKRKLSVNTEYLSIKNACKKYYDGYILDSTDKIQFKVKYIDSVFIKKNAKKLFVDDTLLSSLGFYMPLFEDSVVFYKKNSLEAFALQKKVNYFDANNYLAKHQLIADITDFIFAWNRVKIFYPYQNQIEIDWSLILKEALTNIIVHHKTAEEQIKLLLLKMQDGHGRFFKKNMGNDDLFGAPFKVYEKEKRFFIYDVQNDKFKNDDELLSIDNVEILNLYNKCCDDIAGSSQWKSFIAKYDRLSFYAKGSSHNCEIKRNQEIKKLHFLAEYSPKYAAEAQQKFKLIDDVAYFNLNLIDFSFFKNVMASISTYKTVSSIVFDLRFYPKHELVDFISSLSKDTVFSDNFILPKITSPNCYKNIDCIKNGVAEHWTITPSNYQINKSVYFLISSGSQSYSEGIISIVKDNNLGTLVGERTAGCNGDMEVVVLPSGNLFYFTTRHVQTQNKTCYFIKGIEPTIYIKNINAIPIENIIREIAKLEHANR